MASGGLKPLSVTQDFLKWQDGKKVLDTKGLYDYNLLCLENVLGSD